MQFAEAPGEVEVVSDREADALTSPRDFRGKNLGVTSLDSSTDFLTRYLAVKNGVRPSEFTRVAVGAGPTFISALQKGAVDAGMTTDPTVATITDTGEGHILVDMRTLEGTEEALGGSYPSSSPYMRTEWVNSHRATVQKLADAFVKTLTWMSSHSPTEIADKMPADYTKGKEIVYAAAIQHALPMFTSDGVMPADGPETVEKVLRASDPDLENAHVDLSKTYKTEFVKNATG